MHRLRNLSFLLAAISVVCQSAEAVMIDLVPVGNPGNAADRRQIDGNHLNGVGAVAQAFNIGRTEVTNAQYVAMLNAVAASDPYGLYSTNMGSSTFGGIVRSGASGSYTYAVKAPALSGTYVYDNKPVVFVSSGDAMRFANWLHNGQPTGTEDASTTENGAYTLNGTISNSALAAVKRNSNPLWWLPSENEWYKAAYHDKSAGPAAVYFEYAAGSSSVPNNNQPSSDTGNSANFYNGGYTTCGSSYPLTNAGAYTLSDSPYGTFDQGGNVWEWIETIFSATFRGVRGGYWSGDSNYLCASLWYSGVLPAGENGIVGFRVASVPEPGTMYFMLFSAVAVW